MPCEAAMLADVELFEHLSAEDRTRLAEVVDHLELSAGTTLFQSGEPGESLFVVRAGEIELYIKDTAGQKIVLTVASPGEIFGELALLDRGARTATAVALVDTELLELDREDLLLLFQRNVARGPAVKLAGGVVVAGKIDSETNCILANVHEAHPQRLQSAAAGVVLERVIPQQCHYAGVRLRTDSVVNHSQ